PGGPSGQPRSAHAARASLASLGEPAAGRFAPRRALRAASVRSRGPGIPRFARGTRLASLGGAGAPAGGGPPLRRAAPRPAPGGPLLATSSAPGPPPPPPPPTTTTTTTRPPPLGDCVHSP